MRLNLYKVVVPGLIGLSTLALAGCGASAAAQGAANVSTTKGVPWATVGKVTITPSAVMARAHMLALFEPTVSASSVTSKSNLQVALDEMVQQDLLTARSHPKVSPSSESTYVAEVMASLAQSAYPTKDGVAQREKVLGLTPAQVKKFLASEYVLQAAAQTYVGTMPTSYAKQYYQAHTSSFRLTTEEVNVRHILVKTQAKAEKILSDLKHGASFASLAEKDSIDRGSAIHGGNLGWFGPGVMVAPFSKAAFATPVGHYAVVHSQFGWHVLQVLGREKKGTIPPFSQVEAQVESDASQAFDQSQVESALTKLKKQIRVKFHGVGKNA